MLDQLAHAMDRISTRPRFLLMLALTIGILMAVNLANLPWTLPTFMRLTHGLNILDMEFHYSAEQAYRAIDGYGAAGRALYMHILWPVDVVIPLVASLTLAMAITLGWRGDTASKPWLRYLFALGLLAGLADYAENIAITALLVSYPRHLDGVAYFAGYMTSTKHLLYVSATLVSIAGGIRTWLRNGAATISKTRDTPKAAG